MMRSFNSTKYLVLYGLRTNLIIRSQLLPSGKRMHHLNTCSVTIPKCLMEAKRSFLSVSKSSNPAVKNLSSKIKEFNVKDLVVKHDPASMEFFIEVTDDDIARLKYERRDQLLTLKHTDVPDQLGGQGIGKLLAKVWLHSFPVYILCLHVFDNKSRFL